MDDVLIVLGGTIPGQDIPFLNQQGVTGIFGPGTPMDQIVKFIRANVKPREIPA
jgi:methylmalonyl-CoA mutase C-terminal domain/subunit